jgi:lipoprotein NlpI
MRDESRIRSSKEFFTKILSIKPTHYKSLTYLGFYHIEFKEYDLAKVCIERALEINP